MLKKHLFLKTYTLTFQRDLKWCDRRISYKNCSYTLIHTYTLKTPHISNSHFPYYINSSLGYTLTRIFF